MTKAAPGKLFKEFMATSLGMSEEQFKEFLAGRVNVDEKLANLLAAFTKLTPEYWLRLEEDFRKGYLND